MEAKRAREMRRAKLRQRSAEKAVPKADELEALQVIITRRMSSLSEELEGDDLQVVEGGGDQQELDGLGDDTGPVAGERQGEFRPKRCCASDALPAGPGPRPRPRPFSAFFWPWPVHPFFLRCGLAILALFSGQPAANEQHRRCDPDQDT